MDLQRRTQIGKAVNDLRYHTGMQWAMRAMGNTAEADQHEAKANDLFKLIADLLFDPVEYVGSIMAPRYTLTPEQRRIATLSESEIALDGAVRAMLPEVVP